MFPSLHDPRARSINVLERFFFFFFVADTAVGAIKVVTPTNSLCKFLELLDSLCRMFGVHLRGVQAESRTIEEAIS